MTQPIDREIAMALAKEAGLSLTRRDERYNYEVHGSEDGLKRFYELSVAHSRKDAEPVAWLNPIASFSVITKAEKDSNSFQFSDEFLAGHTVPLYAHPPEADKLLTYGDQRAAEAREQMREECIAICDSHAESCEEMGDMLGMKTADRIADEIKELE